MAKRIFGILVVLVLLALMPIIGTVSLMIKYIAYQLLILSPAIVVAYFYAKSRQFRQIVRMVVKVVGNATNTFVRYF